MRPFQSLSLELAPAFRFVGYDSQGPVISHLEEAPIFFSSTAGQSCRFLDGGGDKYNMMAQETEQFATSVGLDHSPDWYYRPCESRLLDYYVGSLSAPMRHQTWESIGTGCPQQPQEGQKSGHACHHHRHYHALSRESCSFCHTRYYHHKHGDNQALPCFNKESTFDINVDTSSGPPELLMDDDPLFSPDDEISLDGLESYNLDDILLKLKTEREDCISNIKLWESALHTIG